jgi:hypothetical protein
MLPSLSFLNLLMVAQPNLRVKAGPHQTRCNRSDNGLMGITSSIRNRAPVMGKGWLARQPPRLFTEGFLNDHQSSRRLRQHCPAPC